MKLLTQNTAIRRLSNIRETFREEIETRYEPRAKNCLTCEVKGSCCTDAHFVNVHISRLEAVAIGEVVSALEPELRERVVKRNAAVVESLRNASADGSFSKTYSCPLFEKGIGCLVHTTAKPIPCINHACYERPEDLPPSELLEAGEKKISRLNDRVYRRSWNWLPIPEWLSKVLS